MRSALIVCALAARAVAGPLAGEWHGTVDLPNGKLPFAVKLQDASGTIEIQGKQLPLDKVALTDSTAHFEIGMVGVVFDGTVKGDALAGTFKQHGATVRFHMTRGAAATYAAPPPPRIPLSTRVGAALLGTWRGTATPTDAPATVLEVKFFDDHGIVKGTSKNVSNCTPPDPIEDLSLLVGRVRSKVPGANGTAYADLTLAGDALTGTAVQNGTALTVQLTRAHDAPHAWREVEVSIPSTKGAVLAGTLTLPEAPHPPVVVLVTGSGAQDRDECLLGVRPFAQLAAHLADHGIATLRYDDRGYAKSTGDFAASTGGDFADDAQAAVGFLAASDDLDGRPCTAAGAAAEGRCGTIDSKRIGVLGHSEGGMIAPLVATREKRVAFIVLWAGPGIPLDQVIVQQSREIALAEGYPPAKIAHDDKVQKQIWGAWHRAKDRAALEAELAKLVAHEPDVKDPKAFAAESAARMFSPWLLGYRDYDPAKTLAKVRVPILAINGGMDMQVNAKTNLAAIKRAAPRAELVELPGLNHIFQPTKTGAVSEYGKASLDIDPAVLDATTAWIVKSAK